MVYHVQKKTNMKNLCFGGCVALNGVANYRILKEGPFENIHIPPSPGDGGSAIGCAQYSYFCQHKKKREIVNDAERIIELGNFYLGIGCVLTFKNSGLDKVIEKIDMERLILETDSPYLTPVPFRGKRNESKYILNIAEKLAEVKGISLKEIAEITSKNTNNLFNIF